MGRFVGVAMWHLAALALLVVALAVQGVGHGPLFFGQPLLGIFLVGAGVAIEVWVWRRLRKKPPATKVA